MNNFNALNMPNMSTRQNTGNIMRKPISYPQLDYYSQQINDIQNQIMQNQNLQNQMMQNNNMMQNNTSQNEMYGLKQVHGIEEANAFQVAQGVVVPLFDYDSQTIYLKYIDNQGNPCMVILDYTYRNQTQQVAVQNTQETNVNNNYVTQEQFADLNKQIAELQKKLNDFKSKMGNVKKENK